MRNWAPCTFIANAFHFMVKGREPLKVFRLGLTGNLADSTREVGGAEVDVGRAHASKCGTSEVGLLTPQVSSR